LNPLGRFGYSLKLHSGWINSSFLIILAGSGKGGFYSKGAPETLLDADLIERDATARLLGTKDCAKKYH
jgi:hypothetical protein